MERETGDEFEKDFSRLCQTAAERRNQRLQPLLNRAVILQTLKAFEWSLIVKCLA